MPIPTVPNSRCRPDSPKDLLRIRSEFFQKIRSFFVERDFLEVETPILIPNADPSPHLDSFRTEFRAGPQFSEDTPRRTLFLQTSPEFMMKRLVTHGYERIFQICKFFRNGEVSPLHNPEFTGLEWYAVGFDYHEIMRLTEGMLLALWPEKQLEYQGKTLDLTTPWERLTVFDAIQQYAGVTLTSESTRDDLIKACQTLKCPISEDDAWDDLFFKIFLTYVEPKLGIERPVFLMDYPIQMAALARAKPGVPGIAERVELYLGGLELSNGYSELTDPVEQRKRWEEEAEYRRTNGETHVCPPDPGLLSALEQGMPACTGVAVGLDRLLMLYADAETLDDILPFPVSSYTFLEDQLKSS